MPRSKNMRVKIVTFQQLNDLKEGDVLQKFPAYTHSDNAGFEEVITYEIKTINRANQTLNLSVNEDSRIFSWPGDLKRINIKASNMLVENVWWIC